MKVLLTLSAFQDLISNSPDYLPYNSYDFSSENLVLDQLIIDILLYSHHLPAWYCIDIVRRNSVLVTCESERVKVIRPPFETPSSSISNFWQSFLHLSGRQRYPVVFVPTVVSYPVPNLSYVCTWTAGWLYPS